MTINSTDVPDFTLIESIQWDSSWPRLESADERYRILSYMKERFGIPISTFEDYALLKTSKAWHLMKYTPQITSFAQLKVTRVGLKAFQQVGSFLKPTTRMIQTFGHNANKAVVEITQDQLFEMVEGKGLSVSLDEDMGYVILRLGEDMILGLGFYDKGRVHSQLPKSETRLFMKQS